MIDLSHRGRASHLFRIAQWHELAYQLWLHSVNRRCVVSHSLSARNCIVTLILLFILCALIPLILGSHIYDHVRLGPWPFAASEQLLTIKQERVSQHSNHLPLAQRELEKYEEHEVHLLDIANCPSESRWSESKQTIFRDVCIRTYMYGICT